MTERESDIETLLRASILIEQQRKEITRLEIECARLNREVGKWHLLADLKSDTISMFHKKQAE